MQKFYIAFVNKNIYKSKPNYLQNKMLADVLRILV